MLNILNYFHVKNVFSADEINKQMILSYLFWTMAIDIQSAG